MHTRRTTQPRTRITRANSNLDEDLRSYITEASAATRSVKDDWKRLSSQQRPQQSHSQPAKPRRQAAASTPPKRPEENAGGTPSALSSGKRATPTGVRRGSVRGADGVWRALPAAERDVGGEGPAVDSPSASPRTKAAPARRRNAPPAAPSSGKGVRGSRSDRASSADASRPATLQRRGTQQALLQQKRAYATFDGRTSASNVLDFGGPSYTISGSGDPAVDGEYKDAGERRGRRMYRRAADARAAHAIVLWCDGDSAQSSAAGNRAGRRRSSAAQAHASNHHNVWYVSRVGPMLADGHFSSSEHLYESTHGAPSPAGLTWIGLSAAGAVPPIVSHTKVHSVPATPHSPSARALPGNPVDGPVVKLNWLPGDGGRDFDIKSYEVRMRKHDETDASSWLMLALPLVPTDTFADITIGLEESSRYEFAIRASNRWGLSMWSESTVVETRTTRASHSLQSTRTRGRTIAEHAKPQTALGGGRMRETREEKRRSRSPDGRNRAHRSDVRRPSSAKGKELQRQRKQQRHKARENAPRVNGVADGSGSGSRLFQHTASSHATASRQLQKSHNNADITHRDQRQRTAQLNSTRRARRERSATRSRSGSRSRSPTRSSDGASVDSADGGAASTIVEGDDETEIGEDEMEARVRTSSKGGVLGDGLVEVTFQHKVGGRGDVQRADTVRTGTEAAPQVQFAHRKQSASTFLEFADAPADLKAAPQRLAVKSKPPPKAAEFGMSSAQVASAHSLGSPHVGPGLTQQEALDAWANGLSNVGRGGAVGGGAQWSPMKAQKTSNVPKKVVSPTKRGTLGTDRVNGWSSVSRQMMSQWPVFDHDVLYELAPAIDLDHDNIDLSMSREAAAASTKTSARDLMASSVRFDVADNTDETFTPHTVLTRLLPRTPGSGGGLRSSAAADATHRQRGRFAVDFVIENCAFDIGVGVISASRMRRQGHAMAAGASHDRSSLWLATGDAGWGWRSSGGLWHANAAQLLVADSTHGASTAQANAGASPSKQNKLLAPSFEWEDVWRKNVTDMSTRFVTGDVITVELDLFATGPRGRGVLCFRKNGELLPNLFSGLVSSSLQSQQNAQQPAAATVSPSDAFDLEFDNKPTRSGAADSEDEFFFGVTLFGEGDRVRVRRARALESEWAERSSQLSMTRVARAAVTAQRWVRAWRARRAAWELALNAPCVTGVGRPGERHPSLAERVGALALTIAFAQRLQKRRIMGSGGVLEFGGSGDGYAASPPFCLSQRSDALCLQYTLELWIKPLPTGNQWIAVAGRPNSANSNARHIERIDNMQLWLKDDGAVHHSFGRDGGLTTQPNVVRWGVWTHIALVNNGHEAVTFINGESVAQCDVSVDDDSQAALFNANADGAIATPGTFLPSSPCAIVVGGAGMNVGRPSSPSPAAGDTSMCYRGQMSDLRLWQSARSPQQVLCSMRQRLQGAEEGLMGYWPCSVVDVVGQDASNRGRALRMHGAVGANQLHAPEAVFPFERGVPCVPTSTPAATAGHEMSAFALGSGGAGGILHCIATDEGRVAWRHPCLVSHTDTGAGGITVTRSSHGLGNATDLLSCEGVECSTAACAPAQGPQWFMVDLGERFRARGVTRYALRHGHHQGSGTETRADNSLLRRGSTRGPDGVWRATAVIGEQTLDEMASGAGGAMALEDVRKIEPISSWQLLASADGRKWVTLDQRTRNNSLAVAVAQRFVMTRARDGYGEASWDCRFTKKKCSRAKDRLDRALAARAALQRVSQGQQYGDAAEAQAQLDDAVEDAADDLQGIEAEAAAATNTLFRYFCVLRLEGDAKAAAASAAMTHSEAQAATAAKSSGRKRRVGGGSLSRQGGAASAAAAQAGTPLALSGFELYGHLVDLSMEQDLQTQFIDWQRQTILNRGNWQEQETRRQEIQQAELEAHRHRLQLKEQKRAQLEEEERARHEQERAAADADGMVSNPLLQDPDAAPAQQIQEEAHVQHQASIPHDLPQRDTDAGRGPAVVSPAHEVAHDLPPGPPPQDRSGPKGIPHHRTASGQRGMEQLAGLGARAAQVATDRRESGSFRTLGALGNAQVPRPSLAPPTTAARGPPLRRAGWLFKKGSGSRLVSRRNWKKRYCRIVTQSGDGGGGPMLKYFGSPADLVPKGTFALAGCVVEAVENRNHADVFCFDIIAASKTGRTLSLYSESDDVRDQWLACLRHVIAGKLLPQANSDGVASGTPRSPVTPAGAMSDVLDAQDAIHDDELVSTADAEAATSKIMREKQRARAFTSSEVKITRSASRPSTVAALSAQGRSGEEDLGLDYERDADGHVLVTGVRGGSLLSSLESYGKVRIGDVLSAINGKPTMDVDDKTLQQLLASTSLQLTLERPRVFDGLTAASRKALAGFDLAPQASSPLQPAIATRVQPAPTIVAPSPLGEPRQVTLTKSPMGLGLSFVTADIKNIPGWTGRGVIEVDGTVPRSPAAAAEDAGQLFHGDVIAALNGNPVVAKHNASEKMRLPGEHDFESFSNALRSLTKGESVELTLRSGPNRHDAGASTLSPPTGPRLSVAELAAGAAKQRLSIAKEQAKERPTPTRAAPTGSVADMAAAAARRLSQARDRSISDKIKDPHGSNNAGGNEQHASTPVQRRKFSVMSNSALETLQMLEQQFHTRLHIEVEVVEKDLKIPHEVAGDFDCAARCYDNATLSAAYNALAQVHGRLDRFQAEKIDSVEIGQLTSGQQEARMRRQALNRAADALRERIERIIAHVIEPGRELLSSAATSGSVAHKPAKSSARVSVVHDLPPGPPPPAAVQRAAVVDSDPVHVSSGLTVPHDLPPGPPPPLVATSLSANDLPPGPPPAMDDSARNTTEWERAQQARLDAERMNEPPPPPSADELPAGPPPVERAESYRSVEPGNGLPVAAPPTLSRMQRARSVARGDDPSGAAPGAARLQVQRARKASMAELAADRRQAGGMGARRPSVDESTFSFNSSPPPQDNELPRGPPPQT